MNDPRQDGEGDMAITGLPAGVTETWTVANQMRAEQHKSRLRQIVDLDPAVTLRPMVKLLAVLLPCSRPACSGGGEVLRPLWAEEAMHRSYNFLRLVFRQAPGRGPGKGLTHMAELCLATDLAALYGSLAAVPERQVVSCSPVLREIVRDLVALFGPTAGDIELHVNIERVALAAYRRRALVLAASELVINALLHAFEGVRTGGLISVELLLIDGWRARLRISDDGVGCGNCRIGAGCGVAGGLASLLESELVYHSPKRSGTIVELVLPLESDSNRKR
jgi:hypothetical protein